MTLRFLIQTCASVFIEKESTNFEDYEMLNYPFQKRQAGWINKIRFSGLFKGIFRLYGILSRVL